MKKLLSLTLVLMTLLSSLVFVACSNSEAENVVFTADGAKYEITETTTLNDYMNALELDGKLSFTTSSSIYGMFITSVNGVKNGIGGNPCWMVYTDDPDFSDTSDWGTEITIDGKTYKSTTLGISGVIVKSGMTYVLSYVQF
ncbi:MAG: hypothetical protein IKA12_03980 [Clostridia bacterium]|nr:hypothetical protein [Clostridia bacterium]